MLQAQWFESMESLQRNGFQGFMSVQYLQATNCLEMPNEAGVYIVVWDEKALPVFLQKSVGGYFKGRDPTVSADKLKEKWLSHSIVLYVGKAVSLQKRLKQYMDFGRGKPVGHHGGRYIWQLSNSHNLRLCWKTTPDQNPEIAENRLIESFYNANSALPFANLRF